MGCSRISSVATGKFSYKQYKHLFWSVAIIRMKNLFGRNTPLVGTLSSNYNNSITYFVIFDRFNDSFLIINEKIFLNPSPY